MKNKKYYGKQTNLHLELEVTVQTTLKKTHWNFRLEHKEAFTLVAIKLSPYSLISSRNSKVQLPAHLLRELHN